MTTPAILSEVPEGSCRWGGTYFNYTIYNLAHVNNDAYAISKGITQAEYDN